MTLLIPFVFAALVLGLAAGWGIAKSNSRSQVASTSTSAPAKAQEAPRLGQVPVRVLTTLEAWDPFDPFASGFPLPPGTYVPPLVPPGPPIPATPAPAMESTLPQNGSPAPPPLRGEVRSMPPMAVPTLPPGPMTGTGVPPSPKLPPMEEPRLVLASLSGVDPARTRSAVAALGGRFGGSSRTFSHMTEEGATEAEGVLLIIPSAKADGALAALQSLGSAQIEEDSRLAGSERASRLRSLFASRLTALRKRREELLVQFLEAADPIKDMDVAIDKEARAVAAMRLPASAERMATIRILIRE